MNLFERLKELRAKKKELEEKRSSLVTEIRTAATDNKEDEARKKSIEKERVEARTEILEEEIQNILDKIEEERSFTTKGTQINKEIRSNEETRSLQLRAMANTILKNPLSEEERAVISSDNNGAIIPHEFITEFEKLKEGYQGLKQYCHVIPVNSLSGKMPVRKGNTPSKLANLVKDKELVNAMIETQPLSYDIDDYGLLAPIDNSLLEDESINFLEYVNEEFAECAVNTENAEIIERALDLLEVKSGEDYNTLVSAINSLAPNARNRAIIITNSEGRAYLDGLMDKQGRPLLKELSDGGDLIFKGRPVIEVDSEVMPVTADKAEFILADLKTLIKFFDRKQYLIDQSKEAGYTKNQTIVRIIERFDTKSAIEKTDARVKKFGVKIDINLAAV
ncbi:phage major capsid protein [Clostridium senegalense]|uniref:phage major capsid protein n=1 Tax=Clostridium senegalense TaxID=1465809 RepID=UPI000288A3A3|nr:phage major capsid protein [Clostridium senegalense]